MKTVRIYDGAQACEKCNRCPVVDHLTEQNQVVIHDPHKPDSGKFAMTVVEYNALISRAKPIALSDSDC